MSWSGMFKKHNKKTQVETNVVTQRDVIGIREDDDLAARQDEKIKELYAKHDLLIEQLGEEHSRGYGDGLKVAIAAIEDRDGRSGKKQILSDIQYLLTIHEEGN